MFKASSSLVVLLVATHLYANMKTSKQSEDLKRIIITGSCIIGNIDKVHVSITIQVSFCLIIN